MSAYGDIFMRGEGQALLLMITGKHSWGTIGFLILVVGALLIWFALTQAVPSIEHLVAHNGSIENAGWSGVRHGQFVIELANDPARYALNLPMVRDRLGPPATLKWVGKRARLVVARRANRITGRIQVYSLELDGHQVYNEDDLRRFYAAERPKLLLLALFLLALGLGVLAWRRKWAN